MCDVPYGMFVSLMVMGAALLIGAAIYTKVSSLGKEQLWLVVLAAVLAVLGSTLHSNETQQVCCVCCLAIGLLPIMIADMRNSMEKKVVRKARRIPRTIPAAGAGTGWDRAKLNLSDRHVRSNSERHDWR